MDLSIVVPVLNEAENLPRLMEETARALAGTELEWELILVDDGSHDLSYQLMQKAAEEDPRVKAVRLRRNFGQTAAMSAGFDLATGEIIVPLDGDLQNDPADIPLLLAKMEEGYDVVSGWRRDRQDVFLRRRIPSMVANALISRMTEVKLHDYGCTLKAYRRDILAGVNLYGELHRFVPALASQLGARVAEIPVHHRARNAGVSKYGLDRTLRVLLDLITVKFLLKYSHRPLQLFGKWGLGITGLGILSGAATVYMRLFHNFHMNRNPLLILTAFLIFTGIEFVVLGLLAELIMRTYYEAQGKPVYAIAEGVNFSFPVDRRKRAGGRSGGTPGGEGG